MDGTKSLKIGSIDFSNICDYRKYVYYIDSVDWIAKNLSNVIDCYGQWKDIKNKDKNKNENVDSKHSTDFKPVWRDGVKVSLDWFQNENKCC